MSNNTGGAAFPHHIEHPNGHWPGVTHAGMTLRDYFAAKAMQAIINADRIRGQTSAHDYKNECARDSYNMADAMLRAREESE